MALAPKTQSPPFQLRRRDIRGRWLRPEERTDTALARAAVAHPVLAPRLVGGRTGVAFD